MRKIVRGMIPAGLLRGVRALVVIIASGVTYLLTSRRIAAVEIYERRKSKQIVDQHSLSMATAINNMSQGLLMFDAGARLMVCNARYLQMFGLSADRIKPGLTIFELIKYWAECGLFIGDPHQYCERIVDEVASGETTNQSIVTRDGRVIHIVNRPLPEGGWVATHEDVTEKVTAHDLMKTQKLQLDAALENMSQGICMFDGSHRLVVCNGRYIEMYRLAADRIRVGMTLGEIVDLRFDAGSYPAMTRDEYLAWRGSIAVSNKPSDTVTELHNGSVIRIRHRPMPDGGWVATHEDITEERKRESSFRLLFDNNPVAMWVFNCDTFRFLAVNNAAVDQYGYSREQFLEMSVFNIRSEENERAISILRAMPDTLDGAYVGQHYRADGTKIDVVVSSRTLTYENQDARLVAIHDVSEQKRTEQDLIQTKLFLDTVIESVPLPIIVKTVSEGRFTLVNKAWEDLFGVNRDRSIGKTPHEIYDKDRADFIVAQDKECLRSDGPLHVLEHPITVPGWGVRFVTSTKVPIFGSDGKPEYILGLIDDVTERRQADKKIAHLAHSDSLTDLPNRAAFNKCLASMLTSAQVEGRNFAVLCMDLDGFKEVNDVYGHSVGDSLLCKVADRLRAVADGAFVARLGGDEFTIIAEKKKESSITELIDRLLAAFACDFDLVEGYRLRQALSIGVANYPQDGRDAKTLFGNADAALYRAKAEEPGSVRSFEPEMGERLRDRVKLHADLKSAIQENTEFVLHYQPQLKMSGEVIGFEALARWHSSKRGIVPPSEFIPLAEESSLILLLGEWVLREACQEAASWNNALRIAVNISPVQFRHGDLARLVHSILLETGLAPGRLELEITEGVLIDDFSRAVSILRKLKSLGVQIALDDFGTGYSSLSYLHAFPFDKIKIDRTFISDIESSRHSVAIVRAVIGLSRSLNIPVLAEGVETRAQHEFLVHEGCDEVQGYLTGRPLAIADYAEAVGRRKMMTSYFRAG
jgi:diguanylate cyclase (GGDEF)-like protein/PAS domain S-box-containing protein